MRQMLLFPKPEDGHGSKYTRAVGSPVYEPRHDAPPLLSLWDATKTRELIREIDASPVPEDEKAFLRAAAWRHAVFHYERIADYYAHASPGVQRLFERSALVVIDFDDAIEAGFVRLCKEIRELHLEEYAGHEDESA